SPREPPRAGFRCICLNDAPLDAICFGAGDCGMIFRVVTSGQKPNSARNKADQSANPKRRAPSVAHHKVGDDGWRDCAADADAGKNDAIGDTALIAGYPSRDELVCGWIDDSFARAEQESKADQNEDRVRDVMRNRSSQRTENSPP